MLSIAVLVLPVPISIKYAYEDALADLFKAVL
jgi:hypothetical protein